MGYVPNFTPVRNPRVSWRKEKDNRTTLCFFQDCQYHIYELDSGGAFIWELCDGVIAYEKIVEAVLATGAVENGECHAKILSFLLQLKRKNLLRFESAERLSRPLAKTWASYKIVNNNISCRYLGVLHTLPKRPEAPLEAIVEVTKKCNRRCVHCYVEKTDFTELSLDQFKTVLDHIIEAGVLIVHFTGGEPFLRDDFLELVEYIRKKNVRVHIDTNGILADRDKLNKIGELGIDMLNVGFDGSNDKIYGITRDEKDFAKVVHNIQIAVERGIQVVLFFCLHKSNVKDLLRLYGLSTKLGVRKLSIDPYQPLNKSIHVKKELYLPWLIRVLVKLYAFGVSKVRGKSTIISWDRRCNMGLTTFGVHPDGTVSPCIAINKSFGSALSDDLAGIWNSHLFNRYINPSYYGYPCGGCFLPSLPWIKKRYLGKCPLDCRAETLTDTGNIFEGNKHCMIGRVWRQYTKPGAKP